MNKNFECIFTTSLLKNQLMKKLFVLLSITLMSFSAPMDYNLSIYGTKTPYTGNGESYAGTNFWWHNYYNTLTRLDDANNNVTHTGTDFLVDFPNYISKVHSYGFGEIDASVASLGRVTIKNLVDSGEYFKINLLHSRDKNHLIINNNYIVKYQYIGREGHVGLGVNGGNHLHFEVSDSVSTWVQTADAHPGPNNVRPSQFTKGGLIAHYDEDEPNVRYYNPHQFASQKKELLPFFDRTSNRPSFNNFDVYGISNQKIYGYLNINATGIDKVGILSKNTNSRTNVADDINNIYETQTFLAHSTTNFTDLYGNSDNYEKGDYLFIPYVEEGRDKRYGYPVKFSFVDEGSFIVDNDKADDGTAQYREHFNVTAQRACDNSVLDDTINTTINKVPGYFLTSKLAQASNENFCDYVIWKVPNDTKGKYRIYAHIPKGATATRVHYTVHTKSGDKDTTNINQTEYREDWVELGEYASDGVKEYDLDGDSYVKLPLYNTINGQWIAFDAIKFETTRITYPDVKNLNDEYKTAIDYLSNTLPIFSGYDEGPKKGQFGVGDNISRAELSSVTASMLTHILKESDITRVSEQYIKEHYTDWDKPTWFMKYARIVVGMNIMTGYFDEKKLKPENNVTYRELSKIITQSFFYGKTMQKHWSIGTVVEKYLWHKSCYKCLSDDGEGYTYEDDEKTQHTISSVFAQPGKTKIPGSSYGEGGLKATREDVALFLYRAYMLWRNKTETANCVVDEENETEGWGL